MNFKNLMGRVKNPRARKAISAAYNRRQNTGGAMKPPAPKPIKTGASLPPVQSGTPTGGTMQGKAPMPYTTHQGKAPTPPTTTHQGKAPRKRR